MSLFIGNLPRDADEKDLHDLFDKIGSCTFRFKVIKQQYISTNLP